MRRETGFIRGATAWVLSGVLTLVLAPLPISAQEGGNVTWLDDGDARQVSISEIQAKSAFQLFGEGDRAFAGLRPAGNMEFFVTNTGIVDAADGNWDSQPDMNGCPLCGSGTRNQWFDVSPLYAAGRSDWERFVQDVPSLLNAAGQGYSVAYNAPTLGHREINASDLQFGTLFSGVTTTLDGGCQDFSGPNPSGSQASAGVTLLAISNCPPTWPNVGGTPTFLGANVVTVDAFLNSQATLGSDFNFDWWRVDPADVDPNQFFGNIQTYGAYDDYNSALIGRFGAVVPGGSGPPEDPGWPMGIRTEFNAFNFALPTVSNTMFWRSLIINRSEDIYGVGLDFENLYIGYSMGPIRTQESVFYMEVWRGAILTAEGQTGDPPCPGVGPPGGAGAVVDCVGDAGFGWGSGGLIILKSPLGDLRNVLLSCNTSEAGVRQATRAIPCTSDDFFDPGNPHAGDTITYNHFRMCDFGGCTNQIINAPEIQWWGGIASNTEALLNGRPATALPERDRYTTFRNPNYPDAPTPFAYWVPGSWDYSSNGPTAGGDTIWVPTCYGPPGVMIEGTTRENRSDACTVTWSDTMPVGEVGNPAYFNQEGNIAFSSLGPFSLAAGDTAAYVIAEVAGPDSARFEAEVNNAISLYMNFFLAPTPPPATRLIGSDANLEDPAQGGNPTITLFLDDAAEDWVDPFLVDFAVNKLLAGATPTLARINSLNPTLADRILARSSDNVEELLIFKSCDGGTTFTTNDNNRGYQDCDADPVIGTSGEGVDVGWQAFATLPPDASGRFPNQFTDNLAVPGQSFLYVVLGRSRGAQFAIIDSLDTDGDGTVDALGPDSLFVAPSVLNPLATSVTEPNVALVYVPSSIQAGGQRATATLMTGALEGVERPATVGFSQQDVIDDTYSLIFGSDITLDTIIATGPDTFVVTVEDAVTADVGGVGTNVVIGTTTFRTTNPAGVTANLEGNALGFVLVRESTDEPLLVSDVLDGENTTPSGFFSRQAPGAFTGFPGFVVSVDNSDAGTFEQQFYGVTLQDVIAAAGAQPTIGWNDDASTVAAPRFEPFGKYEITWSGPIFGPGSPFRLNQQQPAETQADFEASLAARAVGTTTRTDQVAADLAGVAPEDLVAVNVPFSARNVTFDRDVDMVALRSAEITMLLGDATTGDTVTVTVPANQWIPGDAVAFIETVTGDSATANGVVLDNGQPLQTTREALTITRAQLDCGQTPRPACNPVVGPGAGTTPFITPFNGQVLSVIYTPPFDIESELSFDIRSAIVGRDIMAGDRDVRAQMDSIKAVPNPYIMFSRYELDTTSDDDARLMFTHLPPRGVLRIFTVSGQFVQQLRWGPDDLAGNGDLYWNMRTREGNEAAGGLYVFVVTAQNPATGSEAKKIGKFVIIR